MLRIRNTANNHLAHLLLHHRVHLTLQAASTNLDGGLIEDHQFGWEKCKSSTFVVHKTKTSSPEFHSWPSPFKVPAPPFSLKCGRFNEKYLAARLQKLDLISIINSFSEYAKGAVVRTSPQTMFNQIEKYPFAMSECYRCR